MFSMKRPRWFVSMFLATLSIIVLGLGLVLTGFAHVWPTGAAGASRHNTLQNASRIHVMKTRQAAQNTHLNGVLPVQDHGGPVMRSISTTYAIFWEPPTLQDGTRTHVSQHYNNLILRYFNDVGGTDLYDNNTQYYDRSGHIINNSAFGAAWFDTSPYPTSSCSDSAAYHGCLVDTQIQAEIAKAMAINGWSAGLTHTFFVFTAWGEGSCFDSSSTSCAFTDYCAYHSDFNTSGQVVIYANIAYTGTNLSACGVLTSPNDDFAADSTINVSSHEQMEAVTDPQLNAWYDANYYEVGDKCAWNFATPHLDGGLANANWSRHYYIVQQEWSNVFHSCVLNGHQGTVFVTVYNGDLCALNTNDGYRRWCYHTRRIQGSSPAVANGVVYFGSNDGYVYALTASNHLLWRYQTDSPIVTSSPTVVNGIVYIAATSLYALDARNGSLLWRHQFRYGASSAPAVVNGIVYIGEGDGYLYALSAHSGSLLWRYQTGMYTYSTAATVNNGVVYVGSSNNSIYALNASDGSPLWHYQTHGGINSSAAVSNGIVYIGSGDGSLYALRASDGSPLWHYQTGNAIWSSPVVVDGIVYFGSNDASVYALNASNGALLWRYHTRGRVFSSPAAVNGLIYIGSEDASVYALNASNGKLNWRSLVGNSVYTTLAVYLRS
jgi:outer membrane protein assembly factor BamB